MKRLQNLAGGVVQRAALMLVLFDNNAPRTLAQYLIAYHTITEARARGWGGIGKWRAVGRCGSSGLRGLCDGGQEHPSSAEPHVAEDRSRRLGRRPMERD